MQQGLSLGHAPYIDPSGGNCTHRFDGATGRSHTGPVTTLAVFLSPVCHMQWGKSLGASDAVLMLADGNGTFTKSVGLELDGSGFGLGTRSRRYAMVVEDGVVRIAAGALALCALLPPQIQLSTAVLTTARSRTLCIHVFAHHVCTHAHHTVARIVHMIIETATAEPV